MESGTREGRRNGRASCFQDGEAERRNLELLEMSQVFMCLVMIQIRIGLCCNRPNSWSKISSRRMFMLLWSFWVSFGVDRAPVLLATHNERLYYPLWVNQQCRLLTFIRYPSLFTRAAGIYCFKCHRSWYEGWEEGMRVSRVISHSDGLGELWALSVPAQALRCSCSISSVRDAGTRSTQKLKTIVFLQPFFVFYLLRSKPSHTERYISHWAKKC